MKGLFIGNNIFSEKEFNERLKDGTALNVDFDFIIDDKISITNTDGGNYVLPIIEDKAEGYDFLVLAIGLFDYLKNNYKLGTFEYEDNKTIRGGLTVILKKLKEKTDCKKVCFILPDKTQNNSDNIQPIESFNRAIAEVVGQYGCYIIEGNIRLAESLAEFIKTAVSVKKPKIALLGDSIRLCCYGEKVAKGLSDIAEVVQPPENCRFAKYTLRMIFDYADLLKDSDVIYWNNGQWDVCDLFGDGTFSTIEEYKINIRRIAKILLTYGKKVIFALTTPVWYDYPYNRNSDIVAFNDAVKPMLNEMGIETDDLYSLIAGDIEHNISVKDKIHLSDKGTEICAEHIISLLSEIIRRN